LKVRAAGLPTGSARTHSESYRNVERVAAALNRDYSAVSPGLSVAPFTDTVAAPGVRLVALLTVSQVPPFEAVADAVNAMPAAVLMICSVCAAGGDP